MLRPSGTKLTISNTFTNGGLFTYKEQKMRDTIEEMFRMFKVEINENLINSLVLLVEHEKLNAKHEIMIQVMDKVDEITGKE